jgi:hypothetical protein
MKQCLVRMKRIGRPDNFDTWCQLRGFKKNREK